MNLSLIERRDALIAEAKSLLPEDGRTMSGEVREQLSSMIEETEDLNTQIKAASESAALEAQVRNLGGEGMSTPERDGGAGTSARSLGEHFVKSAGDQLARQARGEQLAVSAPEYGSKAADTPFMLPQQDAVPDLSAWATDFQRAIVNQKRDKLVIADLMGAARVAPGTQSISYLVEKPKRIAAGGPGMVAEGESKPYVSYDTFEVVSEKIKKVAALTKITDETAEDLDFIVSWIDNQLIYDLSLKEEHQLLNGDGTGANIRGLLHREGIQSADLGENALDDLLKVSAKVPQLTQFTPDGVVMNPLDYLKFRLLKDKNGQYYSGGPFQGQYGVGGVIMNPAPWGLKVVDTPAMEEGKYVLGAFRQASVTLRKGGIRVDSTNTNADDFEKNLSTIRAEERLGLMVTHPAAFVTGSIGAVSEVA